LNNITEQKHSLSKGTSIYCNNLPLSQLPVNLSELSEAEQKYHLEQRKPKTKIRLEDDSEDVGFDSKKYLSFVKK